MLNFTMDETTELDDSLLKQLLLLHDMEIANRYSRLEAYYKAQHDITKRALNDSTKPNNKLVTNYARYITSVNVGYFLGVPVAYSSTDTDTDNQAAADKNMQTLNDAYKVADESGINFELATECSKKGVCYELLYTNVAGEVKLAVIKAEEGFIVKSADVEQKVLYGVRRYIVPDYKALTDTTITQVEQVVVYTPDTETLYEYDGATVLQKSQSQHIFAGVPMVEYVNNADQIGDYEQVMTLLDAYNLSQSDTANDFQYFTDAYLVLTNFMAGATDQYGCVDPDKVRSMRENRIFLTDENGDAKWLIKEINDAALENYKNRLQTDIHTVSMTPKLTDEQFAGNLSGVAMRFKLWGLDQNAISKERFFRKALYTRLALLAETNSRRQVTIDPAKIQIEFYRNIPQNTVELAQLLAGISAFISNKTLLEQLPFVDDVEGELKTIKDERQERMTELDAFGAMDPADGGNQQGQNGRSDNQDKTSVRQSGPDT